nr:EOG090X00ST [Cyclestheria hislopi]
MIRRPPRSTRSEFYSPTIKHFAVATEMISATVINIFLLFGTFHNVVNGLPKSITIVGLLDESDGKQELAFRSAIEQVNNDSQILPTTHLEIAVEHLSQNDSFYASRKVCQLLSKGVAAIFGVTSASTAVHIQNTCKVFDIPYIETRWKTNTQQGESFINLQPNPSSLSKAYWDVVRSQGWTSFTILYEDENELYRLQDLLRASTLAGYKVVVRQLSSGDDYRPLLEEMKEMDEKNVVLDCAVERIQPFLRQAKQLDLTTASHSFFISNLDLTTISLEDLKNEEAKIIGLRLVTSATEETLQTDAALIHDGVQLFARALHELGRELYVTVQSIHCEGSDPLIFGKSLTKAMKHIPNQTTRNWLTGPVKFDDQGLRTYFQLGIIEFQSADFSVVGTWDPIQGIHLQQQHSIVRRQAGKDLQNKTFIITSKLSEPYFMLKESDVPLKGNDQFHGFCVDIIEEMSRMLGFKYVFKVVEDSNYGSIDSTTGEWNGMIRELMDGKADLAIGDITISFQREQVVDFTMPFMHTGITILYKKPMKETPGLLFFLSPLSMEVWIYIGIAFLGISLLLFILARMTPYEWNNPHPCNLESDILENRLTFCNSIWFATGSLMLQGSDVPPKAISTRVIAGVWWFFVLIMVSFYTANLVVFLTDNKVELPFESADDLAMQTKIKYGTLQSGSTLEVLKNSKIPLYERMYSFMMSTSPSVFAKSTIECVERVHKSNGMYACLMESSTVEYFVRRRCDLMQVGGLLDLKGYGIAMRSGSPYREQLNQGVLRLQKTHLLLYLKDKWWNHKRGGEVCQEEDDEDPSSINKVNLAEVKGVFAILIAGVVIALLICICECVWKSRKSALQEGQGSVLNEMRKQFRHAVNCSSNTKPAN